MKRRISIISAILLGLGLVAHAAESRVGTDSNSPFKKGTGLLSVKIGSGTEYYFDYGRKSHQYDAGRSPVLALAYEGGVSDLLGIGYIGLGVEGGYAHAKHYHNHFWASEADIYHVGMVGNYHFDFHMLTKEPVFEKIDLYAGLGFFFRYENRYATEGTNKDFEGVIQYNRSDYIFNGCIGGRYFFNDRISAMLQLGSSLTHADMGVTFKLK